MAEILQQISFNLTEADDTGFQLNHNCIRLSEGVFI
jgi:hypothetical protein